MAYSITELLNQMNQLGVFSYVLPFMIVFAVIFGILQKTQILGDQNSARGVNAIIAFSIGGLSLLYDVVPTFFATIFPRFGVGLAVFLVLIIALGFFYTDEKGKADGLKWVGWLVGVGVVLWAFNEWRWYGGGGSNIGYLFQQYLPLIIVLVLIGGGVAAVLKSGSGGSGKG